MELLMALKNPKVLAAIAIGLIILFIYSEHVEAVKTSYDKGVSDTEAAYEKAKNETLTEDVTESNLDAAANLENRNETEKKNEAVDNAVITIISKPEPAGDTCRPADIARSLELLDSIP